MLSYDPHKLSSPQVFLLTMVIFLAIVGFIAIILTRQIQAAFVTNPGLNGLILGVLIVGILLAFAQVGRLFREVRWVNSFRAGSETTEPVLLAPMKAMLGRSASMAFSTSSMRTMLDSIATRLDESRDTSRYLVGLLIFLGLLGTFWGLLKTIASVGEIIGGMTAGADAVAMFDTLKTRLQQPLAGMATSFSTSLFGLAGSLVLGFIDLLSARSANRFYTELEDWLSGMTRLSSGGGMAIEGEASVPSYVQALLEQTADGLERMQRAIVDSERERRASAEQLAELNTQLGRLGELMARESRGLAELAQTQQELRTTLKTMVQPQSAGHALSDELRAEFRLLTRTISAALDHKRPAA